MRRVPSCWCTGWMAERSKALVLGTSLLGGVGSNPTPIISFFLFLHLPVSLQNPRPCISELAQRKRVGLITQRSQDRNLDSLTLSRLAQLVERKTLNLVVVGSSPTVGIPFCWAAKVPKLFFSVANESENTANDHIPPSSVGRAQDS